MNNMECLSKRQSLSSPTAGALLFMRGALNG